MKKVEEIFQDIENERLDGLSRKIADAVRSTGEFGITGAPHSNYSFQVHPLGFLSFRWNIGNGNSLRLNIWKKKSSYTQIPYWPIHDHLFSFRSVVLYGAIQNKTYEVISSGGRRNWSRFHVSYDGNKSGLKKMEEKISLRVCKSAVHLKGSFYDLPAGLLHRSIVRSEFGITLLATRNSNGGVVSPSVIGNRKYSELSYDRDISNAEGTSELVSQSIDFLMKATT